LSAPARTSVPPADHSFSRAGADNEAARDCCSRSEVGGRRAWDIPTPRIDSIAEGGVRFTDAYVSCPVCAPTRAGLLTGRYQQRFGFEHNPGPEAAADLEFGLPREELTIAERLRPLGYATGMVGKWHLGYREGFRPPERGFDEFFGFLGGADSYFPEGRAGRGAILRGMEPVVEPEYLTDAFGREAVDFIERHRDRPFFLYLAFNAVHAPLQALDRYRSRFPAIREEKRLTFAAMTAALDDAVGRVLDTLNVLGLGRDTLVFYLSDNGGPTPQTTSRNDPLRGSKGQVFEGGIRIPFLARWPGRFPVGTVCADPVTSLDILPTLLAAAGSPVPAEAKLDGVDLRPFLTAKTLTPPHDTLCFRFGEQRALRRGPWKLVRGPSEESWALFDLSTDIGETKDLAAARPEKLAELVTAWEGWNAGLKDPLWKRKARRNRSR
jgi:arylsulfatase A-like enzyme